MRVLVIGDCHIPAMHPDYPKFLAETYSQWGCERAVHIGDLVDNLALNFHTKLPETKNPVTEMQRAIEQVAELVRLFPKCDWMLGNHDVLPWRWADTVGIPRELLRTPGAIWGTKKWRVHARYDDFILEGVIYRHGDKGKGGKQAALTNANAEHRSLCMGHLHQQGGVAFRKNSKGLFFGLSTGCGIDERSLHFDYGRRFNERSVLGAGVVIDGHTAIFEPMRLNKKGRL
jgi:predicted phosphodiesterase